jgi:hypothetical protein
LKISNTILARFILGLKPLFPLLKWGKINCSTLASFISPRILDFFAATQKSIIHGHGAFLMPINKLKQLQTIQIELQSRW